MATTKITNGELPERESGAGEPGKVVAERVNH